MRICVVTLNEKGGMVHYASQLTEALSKIAEVTVIVPNNIEGNFVKEVNVVKIATPIKYFSAASLKFYILLKAINQTKPEIVHITSMHPWFIFALLFLRKYPVAATIHDVKIHTGEWNPIWALSLKMLIKYADILFVHGTWAMNMLAKDGVPLNKISTITLGDLSSFKNHDKIDIKETDNILFFGRIIEYKGLEYLIKAEKLIVEQIPNAKIIIAGEGDLSKYDKLIKNNSSFEIYNTYIPEEDIAELFSKVKVVVLPYIECTQSGVIAISYAFRKPVVVTNVGALPEMVEEGVTGFIVPPRDSVSLANAIIKILSNDELQHQMSIEANRKVTTDLAWDNIAKKTIEAYYHLLRM